jgi:uncharacterized protein YjbJ (UPF0337 family)
MDRDSFEKNWNVWQAKIKAKWHMITEEDWREIHGSWERFLTKAAERYRVEKDHIVQEAKKWHYLPEEKKHHDGHHGHDKHKKRKAG